MFEIPVALPPGRFTLATRPSATGSPPTAKTTGMDETAFLTIFTSPSPPPTNTIATRWRTSSAANASRAIDATFRPAVFDRDVLTFDVAGFRQSLPERRNQMSIRCKRSCADEADHRHRLLRTRGARPRNRRRRCASNTGDELPPLHSITSSARASSVGGTVTPIALAVLRLIASSYLVGACTGRLAGFSPFRMRST